MRVSFFTLCRSVFISFLLQGDTQLAYVNVSAAVTLGMAHVLHCVQYRAATNLKLFHGRASPAAPMHLSPFDPDKQPKASSTKKPISVDMQLTLNAGKAYDSMVTVYALPFHIHSITDI